MSKVFIYLLRRDKSDVKMVTILSGQSPTKRITNVDDLNLSPRLAREVESVIYENRMQWEAWIESAASLPDLLAALSYRGLKSIPFKNNPIIRLSDLEKAGAKIERDIDPLAMHRLKRKD